MVMYFVVAPDGHKYGPADVPTLNAWIQEGRLGPDSLLQDASTGAQVVARGIPALKFGFQPKVATPTANPYDMPNPVQPPGSFAAYQQPWNQTPGVSSGQIIGAWVCTLFAPIGMFICFFGLGMSLFGIFTGVSLSKEGSKAAGAALIAINSLWVALFIALRIAIATGWGPFG